MKKEIDWQKIKNEYITTEIGYRPLAAKYGVSFRTLTDRAGTKGENWVELRNLYKNTSVTAVIAQAVTNDVGRMARIMTASDKAIGIIEEALLEVRNYIVVSKVKTKIITIDQESKKPTGEIVSETTDRKLAIGDVDPLKVKYLSEALKNLKDIQMIKSALDTKEQEVRIAKAEADVKNNGGDESETGVVMLPDMDEDGDDNDECDLGATTETKAVS